VNIDKLRTKDVRYLDILMVFLLMNPTIDLLTSIMKVKFEIELSIGILLRGLFLVFTILYLVKMKKYNPKLKLVTLCYLVLVGLYIIGFFINVYSIEGIGNVISEGKDLIKAFYFPIILIGIVNCIYDSKEKLNSKIIANNFYYYAIVIILAGVSQTFIKQYSFKAGHVGWFYAPNEVGAIMSIIFPTATLFILESERISSIIKMITISAFVFTMYQIGTKVPGITVIVTFMCIIIHYLIKFLFENKNKNSLKKMIICIILVIFSIGIFIVSPTRKNLNQHSEWFDINKDKIVESYIDGEDVSKQENISKNDNKNNDTEEKNTENIMKDEEARIDNQKGEYDKQIKDDVNNEETEENINKDTKNETRISITDNEARILSYIFSSRDRYALERLSQFKNAQISEKIFGMGYLTKNSEGLTVNSMIEIDYLDIWFSYGILGTIIYWIPILLIIVSIVVKLSKNLKVSFMNLEIVVGCISVLLGFGSAFFAGHVFTAPAVSIYVVINMVILLYKIGISHVNDNDVIAYKRVNVLNGTVICIVLMVSLCMKFIN